MAIYSTLAVRIHAPVDWPVTYLFIFRDCTAVTRVHVIFTHSSVLLHFISLLTLFGPKRIFRNSEQVVGFSIFFVVASVLVVNNWKNRKLNCTRVVPLYFHTIVTH